MMRLVSMMIASRKLRRIFKPGRARFFGMKLHAHHVAAFYRRCEWLNIMTPMQPYPP